MVFLEDLVASNIGLLYPTEKIVAAYPFRLTRNGEIDFIIDESSDFLISFKKNVQTEKKDLQADSNLIEECLRN